MPGLEVCKVLKTDPATRHIPIIMLTAKAEEIDRIVGLEFGADDYVTKPFSPRELVLRVNAILRRGKGEAAEEKNCRSARSRSIRRGITSPWRKTGAAHQRRIQTAQHADAAAGAGAGARPVAQ